MASKMQLFPSLHFTSVYDLIWILHLCHFFFKIKSINPTKFASNIAHHIHIEIDSKAMEKNRMNMRADEIKTREVKIYKQWTHTHTRTSEKEKFALALAHFGTETDDKTNQPHRHQHQIYHLIALNITEFSIEW